MSWDVPNWWQVALLALAAFRSWRLLAEDTLLDRPRTRFLEALPAGEYWLTCPWCAGWWVSLGWWLGWATSHHWLTVAAAPFAISALVGLIAANLDPD